MTWRQASASDLGWVRALLLSRVEDAMFLLANLAAHGLEGGDHPHALDLFVREDRRAACAVTRAGAVLLVVPQASVADWRALAMLIAQRPITAVLAETGQARAFVAATGLGAVSCQLDRDDPRFLLALAEISVERRTAEELVPLGAVPRDLALGWRAAYEQEVLGVSAEQAAIKAEEGIAQFLEKDSHRILLDQGQPVAMTGFNAEISEAVQVGGVYTPPQARGQGYARRAVGLHLLEARARGASQAVLFAASEPAARAYRAIGFRPAGAFALILFARPAQLRAEDVEICT